MPISNVNGLPRSEERRTINWSDYMTAKLNNPFFLSGSSPSFPDEFPNNKEIIIFLEIVQSSGTFTIEDAEGNIISGALTNPFGCGCAPLRLDGGFKLNGTILGAVGCFLQH